MDLKNYILLACETYPDENGGVHRYVFESAKFLAKLGHRVTIIAGAKSKFQKLKVVDHVAIQRFILPKTRFVFLHHFIQIVAAIIILNRVKNCDCLWIHNPLFMISARCSRHRHRKIVYFFHAPIAEEFALDAHYFRYQFSFKQSIKHEYIKLWISFNCWAEKLVVTKADAIVCLSNFMKSKLLEYYPFTKEISVIPAGIDLDKFQYHDMLASRNRLNLPLNRPILLTVRRLVSRMGLLELIESMVQIDAILLIGGAGPLLPPMKSLIDKLNLKHKVFLLGSISDKSLPYYYSAANFFVLPTLALEGFGIVTIEAMACGLPVIGTIAGAIPEVIAPFNTDFLIPSTTPDMIAQTINKILSNRLYGSQQFRESCRAYTKSNFSWNTLIYKLIAQSEANG